MVMWAASVSTVSVFGTEGVRDDENLHKDQTTAVYLGAVRLMSVSCTV